MKLLGILYIIGGIWLLNQSQLVSASADLSSVLKLSRDIGILSIVVGIGAMIVAIFGLAATIRQNVFFLKFVCYSYFFSLWFEIRIGDLSIFIFIKYFSISSCCC